MKDREEEQRISLYESQVLTPTMQIARNPLSPERPKNAYESVVPVQNYDSGHNEPSNVRGYPGKKEPMSPKSPYNSQVNYQNQTSQNSRVNHREIRGTEMTRNNQRHDRDAYIRSRSNSRNSSRRVSPRHSIIAEESIEESRYVDPGYERGAEGHSLIIEKSPHNSVIHHQEPYGETVNRGYDQSQGYQYNQKLMNKKGNNSCCQLI